MCYNAPMKKEQIIQQLKDIKPFYEKEGVVLVGLFGSRARADETRYSDVDVAYRIDHDRFSKHHKGGFAKLVRLETIQKDLTTRLGAPVDLVPDANTAILKDLIRV